MKIYILRIFFFALLSSLFGAQAIAQDEREPYTGNNTILIAFEGQGQRYEFKSEQMLVRHNRDRHTLECVVPVATLVPLNDTIPPAMAYEVLFGAKYPELLISIAAPEEQLNAAVFVPSTTNRTTTIVLQGINNETVVPIAILSDKNSFYFSTNFDLNLENFQASLPVKYLPVLTGRVLVSIDKAYWYNL
ncbi:hypothetical protein [Pontibacter russatus]|uniref:hypothetical protein n=1 Tax=Pontibacter russatus TaxID=2694929 RepID=UPI0013798293|nr:hypothetical protein [Pontibacter russatus]